MARAPSISRSSHILRHGVPQALSAIAIAAPLVTVKYVEKGTGIANGTFGELLQGALRADSNHFLVTLPIHKFSRVVFAPNASSDQVTVTPRHKTKSRALVEKLLNHYQLSIGGHLTIESELPEGKGMASSSSDLVASARAFESALGRVLPVELLLEFMRATEPSDGVIYPEFVTFFHRRVELCRKLGFPSGPGLRIVAVDEGGQIDTIDYNRRHDLFTNEECTEYAELLRTIEEAILSNNLAVLGRVATRSAILNQKRNPKRYLARMIEISEELQALGVVITHSGPCIGLLFSGEPRLRENIEKARRAVAQFADSVFLVESLSESSEVKLQS